ncbi:MAG: PilZ domain [Acidobacteriota bacterium]
MLAEHSDLEAYVQRELPRHGEISLAEPEERRTEARYPTLKTGTIHPVSPAGRETMTAYVMDISKHGMKVRVERAFEPGDRVQVLLPDLIVLGEVRHCSESHGRFHLGLAVISALQPNAKKKRTKKK